MENNRVGVDLAKNVYQAHGVDRKDKPVWRRQLSRYNWRAAIVKKVEQCVSLLVSKIPTSSPRSSPT